MPSGAQTYASVPSIWMASGLWSASMSAWAAAGGWRFRQEVDQVAGAVVGDVAEWIAFENGFDLSSGAGHAGHVDVEFVGEQLLDGGGHGGGVGLAGLYGSVRLVGGDLGSDDDVAALEDRDGVAVAGLGQLGAQLGHGHPVMAADVDPPRENHTARCHICS